MGLTQEQKKPQLLHFGGFSLDLQRHALYRGQKRIRLTPKPLEALIFLVENRGRTIEKQELLDAVWKDTFVTEDNLVQAVREIRRALSDDKDNPRFVQTVPRQGYRFVGEVSDKDETSISAPKDQAPAAPSLPLEQPERRILRWFWVVASVLALFFVLAWLFWPQDRLPPTLVRGGSIKQITAGEFTSAKPAFSRDGRFILYVSSSQETRGHGDLFIRQFPEGNALRITNRINPSGDIPIFTSDGSHVVFALPRKDRDDVRHHDLWIVPSFGGPPKRFIEDASGAGFSPDGKWVAYTKHLPSGNALRLGPVSNPLEHLEVKAESYTPRWSSTGEWLSYTTSDPNGGVGHIWICRVVQSKEGEPKISDQKQVTREKRQIYGLTWTADSRSIVFASKRDGSSQLHEVSIADGSIGSLATGVGEYLAPSLSPDGHTLIFQHHRLVNDLVMTTLGGHCEETRFSYGEFHDWPRISPSGGKLVSVLRQVDNTERLYLTDLKTKEVSQLSDRAARHPCWLDEENVAFLTPDTSSKNTEVLVVSTRTRETRSLTHFSGQANWLAIHPDKKRVAVVLKSVNGKEAILVRELGALTNSMIHEGSEYEYLRWSPDGSTLCWNKPGASRNAPHSSEGIWAIRIGQSEPYLIAKEGYCPVWSEDGAGVYFTLRNGEKGLWLFDLRQEKMQRVCSWGMVHSFDIVGSGLVFTQHKSDSQIYSMSLAQ